ncbi:MAG: NAD(P)/FAD-dependent oxidoreductase [archaeon]
MTSKSIIIIGAGVAGLSAGCYAQMNGFEVRIFEMHNLPGGLCTAWQRNGYTFDGCIHWLVGSSPRSGLYNIWQELGLIQGRQFLKNEYYARAVDEQGNELVIYTDIDRLEENMLKLAPEDERLIKSFTHDMRALSKREIPLSPSLGNLLKMLPVLRLFSKYAMSIPEFSRNFRNSTLRKLFTSALEWHEMSMIFIMMNIAWMSNGSAAYPVGGSLPLAKSLEQRFLNLGGMVSYGSKVSKILVENNEAVGIKLTDGTEHRADIVISAADGHSTIFDWLEGKYLDEKTKNQYESPPIFPPLVFVTLGVNADLTKEPITLNFPLKNPVSIAGRRLDRITVRNHSFDPTLAPAGKTVLSCIVPSDYEYWTELGQERERYQAEKKNIQEAVVNAISERYPNIRSRIETVDVATPLTYVRFTGNWRGSYQGWLFTKETMRMKNTFTLPGLSSFYMAGHWVVAGGGLPGAAISARRTIQMLCKNERVSFKTTIPLDSENRTRTQ